MVKKIEQTLEATLTKNTSVERGGAWLLTVGIKYHEDTKTHSAWSNPSAAKRYLKEYVLANTPRKSIKMEVKAKDVNEKPTHLAGELTYKVEA